MKVDGMRFASQKRKFVDIFSSAQNIPTLPSRTRGSRTHTRAHVVGKVACSFWYTIRSQHNKVNSCDAGHRRRREGKKCSYKYLHNPFRRRTVRAFQGGFSGWQETHVCVWKLRAGAVHKFRCHLKGTGSAKEFIFNIRVEIVVLTSLRAYILRDLNNFYWWPFYTCQQPVLSI